MFWSLITAALINSKTTDSLLNHFDTTEIFINQIIYVLNGIISIYSKDSSLVIGGIVFLISFGLHLSAVEWAKDMS